MGEPDERPVDRCLRFADLCQEHAEVLRADAYICRGPEALAAAHLIAGAVGGRVYCDIVALPLLNRRDDTERPSAEHALLEHAWEGYLCEAAGLWTAGWALKDRLRRYGQPVTVIPDYHDGTGVTPADRGRLRAECGLGPDDRLLLASGTTVGGFRPIVGAMPMLPADVHLAVLADIAQPSDLRSCIDEQGIAADRIHLLPPTGDADVVGLAMGAELGLIAADPSLPDERAALPARLFDFIAAELPIVAADVPDVARIVEERDLGITVGSDDATAWGDAISTALARGTVWRGNLTAAASELAWDLLGDAVHAACGYARRVVFLSCRSFDGDRRTRRMAQTLANRGTAVTTCCPRRGSSLADTRPSFQLAVTAVGMDTSGPADVAVRDRS